MLLRRLSLLTICVPSLLTAPANLAAQKTDDDQGWNDPVVLDLVRRGVERRASTASDGALRSYNARGLGYVYFILDAPTSDLETLVRTDQVAVDVHWRAPSEVRQRVVGMRERRELPVTGLYYYRDRFTVIQDDFGESIVIADGDNVRDVRHPVGPGAEEWYEYRLADSLALRLSGVPDPVQVYEIEVRPRNPEVPAVIGAVFLESTTGAVVRMNFTFTPSAYVDPRLDYINVVFENGLWNGRYWLPHEQRLEIRRELPELDIPFGTVIRTRMRVGDYRINEPVPEWLFATRIPVTMTPRADRESFPFDQPIDAEWRQEGLGKPIEVQEVRRAAQRIARDRALSGVPATRLAIRSASELFRYNRAEGLVLGAGISVRPTPSLTTAFHGGWAFGADHPKLRLDATLTGRLPVEASVYLNRGLEIGRRASSSGVANTIGSLFVGSDWSDPFYATGTTLSTRISLDPAWSLRPMLRLERQSSAGLTTTYSIFDRRHEPRTLREIDTGTHVSGSMTIRRELPMTAGGWWGEGTVSAGRLNSREQALSFARTELTGGRVWSHPWRRAQAEVTGRASWAFGDLPRQEMILLGGRGSLPGYGHHAFTGDRAVVADFRASAEIAHPWLRGRVMAGFGWSELSATGQRSADLLDSVPADSPKPFVGVGAGLFYDLLHIDVARGLGTDGRTQLIVEFPLGFWDFL